MKATKEQMTAWEAVGYIIGLACGFVRGWPRAVSFGVGLTLLLSGAVVFWVLHQMDPGDNTPGAILIGGPVFCIGAILFARAIWPPHGPSK